MNQLSAPALCPANVRVVDKQISVWNLLDMIRKACQILCHGCPLGRQPHNMISHDLSLKECICYSYGMAMAQLWH